MTVYCPNCGKPNTDEANACASCGTQLTKPGARKAAKFKGTMMMAGVTAPTPPGAQGSSGEAGAPPKKDLALQQTMLGPMTPPGQQPPGAQGSDSSQGAASASDAGSAAGGC